MSMDRGTCHNIVFVAFDGFQLLDLAGPLQVFTTAGDHARDDRSGRRVQYRTTIVSRAGTPVIGPAGLSFATSPLPVAIDPDTTLIVVGGAGVDEAASDHALIAWLRESAPQASRVCSVCNGAFFLARAGLLDGRRATTHWIDCDALNRRYPAITVDRDAIYVRDGNVWTSAGASAGIDLALALVDHDFGPNAAAVTARRLVLYVRRPGNQSQFSDMIEIAAYDAASVFGYLHQWIVDNIDCDLSNPALARRAGMSERTFARKYAAVMGMSPAEAVNRLRAETARTYLRSSVVPLKTVCRKSGFGSVAHMNRVLLKTYGLSPHLIRQTL